MIIGAVIVFHDVTRLRRMTKRISWQASHDALTGIYNRLEFEDRLSYLLRSIKNEERTHALLYIDLDKFKRVNDTCGHKAGDRLLKAVTTLVQKLLRKSDIFARLGGDEFGIILTDCPPLMAEKIARKICSALNDYIFLWGKRTFGISASIGISVIGQKSKSVSSILASADRALYSAKNKGGNRVFAAKK
jgi:diguanylate cyclase (GGDEF)-like protein